MKIKELIEALLTYENQDAKVLLTVGNEDGDTLSTSDFVCFSDTSADGYVELYVDEDECSKQI
jgi:hypothetical protein